MYNDNKNCKEYIYNQKLIMTDPEFDKVRMIFDFTIVQKKYNFNYFILNLTLHV